MRMSTAYAAGAGTVAIAVAIGLGGGLMIANVMSPTSERELSKVERHVAAQTPAPAPIVQSAPTSSYLNATQGAATTPVVIAPAAAKAADTKPSDGASDNKIADSKPAEQPQTQPVNSAAAAPPPAPSPAPTQVTNAAPQPQQNPQASAQPAQQQTNAPENAFAKARDSDLARANTADTRRAERRRDRHQQWAERNDRRNWRSRDPDPRDIEQTVRDDSAARDDDRPREVIVERSEPVNPFIRLFTGD